MKKELNNMDRRYLLHKYIYPEYIDNYINLIKEGMPCFVASLDKKRLTIVVKIKKTDFKRVHRYLDYDTVKRVLSSIFHQFLYSLNSSITDENINNIIQDILSDYNYDLLQSITLLSGGDLHIKL